MPGYFLLLHQAGHNPEWQRAMAEISETIQYSSSASAGKGLAWVWGGREGPEAACSQAAFTTT